MIKEALCDGMDGWDWMVIIGHRYSRGTFAVLIIENRMIMNNE